VVPTTHYTVTYEEILWCQSWPDYFWDNQQAYSWTAMDLLIFHSFCQAYGRQVHYSHTVGPTTYMYRMSPTQYAGHCWLMHSYDIFTPTLHFAILFTKHMALSTHTAFHKSIIFCCTFFSCQDCSISTIQHFFSWFKSAVHTFFLGKTQICSLPVWHFISCFLFAVHTFSLPIRPKFCFPGCMAFHFSKTNGHKQAAAIDLNLA